MTFDTELFRREVDDLDTGLPAVPDLAAVRSVVRRHRRRRRAAAGAGALAAVLGAAAVLAPAGGGRGVDAAGTEPAPTAPTAPTAPAVPTTTGLAGPWFGPQVEAAVAEVLPGLTRSGQLRGDHYLPLDSTGTYRAAVRSPVRWSTFFQWTTFFDAPADGVKVDVSSTRDAPDGPDLTGATGACRDGLYPVRVSCEEVVVGGRTVVVSDGIRFERGGVWHRQVEVSGPEGVRGMDARVVVSAFGEARSQADADAQLPSLADLQRLALDPDLVLPEPLRFPDQFPD